MLLTASYGLYGYMVTWGREPGVRTPMTRPTSSHRDSTSMSLRALIVPKYKYVFGRHKRRVVLAVSKALQERHLLIPKSPTYYRQNVLLYHLHHCSDCCSGSCFSDSSRQQGPREGIQSISKKPSYALD